jgi:hypothetical protein
MIALYRILIVTSRHKKLPNIDNEISYIGNGIFCDALVRLLRRSDLSSEVTTDEVAKVMQEVAGKTAEQLGTLVPPIVELRKQATQGWRLLAKHGYGRFVSGRRGGHSRFAFNYGARERLREQLDVAMEPTTTIAAEPGPVRRAILAKRAHAGAGAGVAAAPSTITHHYVLRPGLLVELPLPADLTAVEAARLARFVESLPFDGPLDRGAYDAAWGSVIARRLNEVDEGSVKPVPWSEARAQILEDD